LGTNNKNFKVKNGLDVGGSADVTGDATIAGKLSVTASSGDEGGEILLAKPATNTNLVGTGVTVDVFQNKLRFFEQGGDARGYYVDITGGGGGASTVGEDAVLVGNSGNGGSGSAWLDGVVYAGGGGGGYTAQGAVGGSGGPGGGGNGATNTMTDSLPGTDGLGGGGGAGGNQTNTTINGSKGGDGVVIVRYEATASFMTGGTITTSGSYVYHTFTNTTGSFTLTY
jgi:hypothetical protein